MPDDDDGRLDLTGLYGERRPPPALEERVVKEWAHAVGAPVARRAGAPGWTLRAAAGVALFLAGWGAARVGSGPAASPPLAGPSAEPLASAGAPGRELPRFMLLLWTGPGFRGDPDDPALSVEYGAWARGLAVAGVEVSGEELADARSWVPPGEGVPEVGAPGPRAEEDLRLGGYFVVAAESEASALEIARRHPHGRHGGWVEVAAIVEGPEGR
jgi:hypothetical protein